jgi:hypothetical protein
MGLVQVGRPIKDVEDTSPLKTLTTEKIYVWLVSDFLPGHGDAGKLRHFGTLKFCSFATNLHTLIKLHSDPVGSDYLVSSHPQV